MSLVRRLRRTAALAKRQLFPSPAVAAWRHACRLSEGAPRYQRGEIAMNGYRLTYADLLTLCPQWHDIFVNRSLRFTSPSPSPRILDCGANIGLASLYFKTLYPSARITAYEADPAIAAICQENLRANRAADVSVQHAAVWTRDGVVAFRREGADSGAIDGVSAAVQGHVVDVPAVRLRDVIAGEPVDLLKLDIEGAEGAVLADCADVLDRVRALVLDLHEFDAHYRQTPAVLTLLESAGFTISVSDTVELPWRGQSSAASPFPQGATAWASTVRAWRE